MINKEQEQKIQKAIEFCCDEIEKSGDYEEHYCDSQITADNIENRAIEMVTDNLEGFELLDINLNNSALVEQEKEIINYIEKEL